MNGLGGLAAFLEAAQWNMGDPANKGIFLH
jgi:hypothetical protein